MTGDALQIENLTVRFGGLMAVKAVSMTVGHGEIRGLIGPNGAGKTTFFNAISGIVPVSEGRIAFLGRDISAVPAHGRAALGIRRTFQSLQLINEMSVLENVLIGLHSEIPVVPWQMARLWGRDRAEDAACRKACDMLERLGIRDLMMRPVGSLSFAEQRQVEIARALVTAPKVLMLDEPAAGLSPPEIARLGALVRQLRNEHAISIILVEHVISLVMDLCDSVSVFDNGALIADGRPDIVAADPRVRAAYLGEETHAASA